MMKMPIKINSLALKIAGLVFVTFVAGIGIVSYFSYKQANEIFITYSAKLLERGITEYERDFKRKIEHLINSLELLRHSDAVLGFVRAYYDPYHYDEQSNKTLAQYERDIKRVFKLLMAQNRSFFQIRLIDTANGREVVKGVKVQKHIIFAQKEALQYKRHRDYFQGLRQTGESFYFSAIDLNKEFHTIEFPIKPTLRIGTRVGERRHLFLLINVNVATLLNFEQLRRLPNTRTYIANMEGYYILNTQESQKEFGFEFGEEYKITDDFPFVQAFFNAKTKRTVMIKDDKIYGIDKFYVTPKRYILFVQEQSANVFAKRSREYINQLLGIVAIVIILLTIMTALFVYLLTKPILRLSDIAKEIARTKGERYIQIDVKSNDEIGELADSMQTMLDALVLSKKEIQGFANKLEEEVAKKTKELKQINENLQRIVKEKVAELRQKDHALSQQAKMAAMGEMLGAIAHQWRQPLNDLAINIQLLEDMAANGELDQERIEGFVDKNMKTIKFMSDTIDDFRNFFRKDKEKVRFSIKEAIANVLRLQRAQLEHHQIHVEVSGEDAKIEGYRNEFMQALLNIISNAKDAIMNRREREGFFEGVIKINVVQDPDAVRLEIEDNGGGIPKEILDRIFEPYFTTKEEGKGTGMGLWMVKEIIERMGGKVEVANTKDGAKFTIVMRSVDED